MREKSRKLLNLFMVLISAISLIFIAGCSTGNESEETTDSSEATETTESSETTENDEETEIVIYSAHGSDMLNDIKAQFEAENPDVEVVYSESGGNEALNKILAEKQNPQANILFGGPQHYFYNLEEEELLVPYEPSWIGDIDRELYSSESNSFTVNMVSPVTIGINTEGGVEMPAGWLDLANEEYEGKIITLGSYSASFTTALAALAYTFDSQGVLETEGKEWFQAFDQNILEMAEIQVTYDKISNNTDGAAASILVIPQWETMIKDGAPLEYQLNPTEGVVEIGDGIGIIAGTEEDEAKLDAAQRYIDFVGQYDMQLHLSNEYNRKPTNPEAIENSNSDWMKNEYKIYDLDWKELTPKYDEYVDLIFNQWFQ